MTPNPDPTVLNVYTIYRSPLDHPDFYVIRRFEVLPSGQMVATPDVTLGLDIEEMRRLVPYGLTRLYRDPDDHSSVVETWV
jgi:hypothetical protein